MHPLATADPIRSALREVLDLKRKEATERWDAFESERKRLVEAGTDLAKDAAAVRRLDDLHGDYLAVADEAKDAEARYFRALDGKAETLHGTGRDGSESVGAEFLKRLGVGG